MERILKCAREIIRSKCPVSNGLPSIFGIPIKGWFHGDRAVIAENDLPAIAFDSEDLNSELVTFHGYQRTWNFSILPYIQLDYSDDSTTFLNYVTNMIDRIMRQHTKMWIFESCFICGQDFLNPSHLMSHPELTSLATTVRAEFTQRWTVTHQVQGGGPPPPSPTMNDADAYATAYYRLYDSGTIASPTNVTFTRHKKNITMSNQDILNEYKAHLIIPVRFLSFVMVDSINYGVVAKINNQYLRGSQIKVSAKEIDPVHIFGPNNV